MPGRDDRTHAHACARPIHSPLTLRNVLSGALAALMLAGCGGVTDDIPAGSFERAPVEWQLIFEDNFDGTSLDAGKWNIQTGDGCPDLCGWGNGELQVYSEDNISVGGGLLTIEGRQELDGSYTSARINTKGKLDFTYGRVEVRARLPGGKGAWPAIWMLHTNETYGTWPSSGEIDIAEGFNLGVDGNTSISSTLHYGMPVPQGSFNGSAFDLGVSPEMGFHVYEMEWEKDKIRFYVDGQHYQTQNSDNWYAYYKANAAGAYDPDGVFRLGSEDAPFDHPFHLLLNLAIGGNPVGAPDDTTPFPLRYEVDYVRVYQCANANPTTGRGCGRADPSVVPLEGSDSPFIEKLVLYEDGPAELEFTLGTETATNMLEVDEFNGNGTVIVNDPLFTDPDDPENTVWHVNITGSGGPGNVFLKSEDLTDDPLLDTGFDLTNADLAGQLIFDMRLNSIVGTTLLAKLDSGFPDVGEAELGIPMVGEWVTYAIDIADIVANPGFVDCCGGEGVDLMNVINPFVFEVLDGDVDVYIDNIQLTAACKENICSATARTKGGATDVIVFDDAVGEVWTGGIQASDSGSGFTDYSDPNSANKINWEIKPAEDPARGDIVEVVFKDDGSDGVWFVTSNPGVVDMSGFASGAVVFDLRVLDYGANTGGMTMKIDCQFPCSSNDFNLGVVADGVWETITVPVSRLLANGPLDLTTVNTGIVVFPKFGDQAGGIRFQLDNIRWTLDADVPPPILDPIDLPVTFDEEFVNYTLIDFGDPVSASTVIGEDPEDAMNMVAITTKPSGAPVWAGTVIGNDRFANPIPFTDSETRMSVRVRAPAAGIPVLLKVENEDASASAEVTATTTVANEWETLVFDLRDSTVGTLDPTGVEYVRAIIFFDFGTEGDDSVYYWDDVRFGVDEPPPPPPPSAIVLSNAGFEAGDLGAWAGTGDNSVGAPGVGARGGDFAAQLTVTGGGGVSEVSQTFAASPGDEVYFSVWMLTEAPIPAGASFGLAKIVFKDADGNDLVPASASIGVINTEFPGIESQPFLNSDSPVNTWVLSEAQGVAPEGTVEVAFLLLNVDFAGGENPIWFDDAQANLVDPGLLLNGGFEAGDFGGWAGTGDNSVGAPGAGAHSGASAALLTVTGGGGVAEISQRYAARPGDEYNLSTWMLTEAAIPEGASFGLAKIVFKDADGNDLVPASASIGVINTEFPGVESQPFLNNASPVDTWVFSEAQGVAPEGTVEVAFLLLNVDFAGGENPIWFDDAHASLLNPGLVADGGFEGGDFGNWAGTGDNTIGAPAGGANSGAFAAQLTVSGGGGVSEIGQSFGASPGDEYNLSTWMLTEAPLPAGASFGLAKIVFKDADGNDLVPESASIGVINTEFPGVESQPFLNSDSPVGTWVFSEAQGVAPAGTTEVRFLLLNVDFAGGENPIWFDDARARLMNPGLLADGGFESGDFGDWTGTGDNFISTPAAGAHSGDAAAVLTVSGGGGVSEISQSFAANPGDEFNLSTWMLTEAPLPAGASFGLAKIVFKDSGGADLVPESASKGVINTEFPGIESQPFLNSDSPVDTWVFSEAQGVAPAGTVEVRFLLLNVDFAGGENPIWFDDARARLISAGAPAVALVAGE